MLSDDPASAAHDVHPYDRSASLSGPASYGLDQDMAMHETQSHDQLHWGVEEVALDEPNSLTLAFVIAAAAHERLPQPSAATNGPLGCCVIRVVGAAEACGRSGLAGGV